MKLNFLLACLVLCICSQVQAQSLEEFKAKYTKDKVVYTKQIREYYFSKKGKELDLRSTTTLKLLFMYDDANAYSQQSVFQSSFSAISNLKAKTTVNGKDYEVKSFVTKTNETRNVFFDDSKVIAFNLLNIGAGATAEITYDTYYPNPILLPDVYFTSYLPIHEQEAIFYVDKDIDFKYFEFNLKDYNINFTKEEKRGKIIYKWTGTQVPEVHIDNFKFNNASSDMFLPHVITYIASYESKDKLIKLQTNIDDLYKWSYDNLSAGIGKSSPDLTPSMKQVVDSIKSTANGNQEQVLKNIYTYVQKNIYYVAIEDSLAGFIPRKPSLVMDRKYGDCKDMACLLYSMLSYAGFKSYPTWIGTRDIMYDVDKVPLISCFNHMITSVDFNGKTYFLDPTMNFLPYDLPAYSVQGKQALLSDGPQSYKLLRVPTSPANATTLLDSTVIRIGSNNTLVGTVKQKRSGYSAMQSRYKINFMTNKEFEKDMSNFMARGNAKCVIKNAKASYEKDVYHTLDTEGDIELPDYITTNGDNIYVNMNLQKLLSTSVYQVENLIAPTENEYNYEFIYVTRLAIPEGMKVKYTPDAFTYSDKNFDCSLTYTVNENEVMLIQKYSNKELYWYKDYYKTWNDFQKKLVKNYKESVVLVKK
ncbi:MAG: hypothetical protein RL660_2364 [Bacteroidota bacterium]|jgi:hypothetical protein